MFNIFRRRNARNDPSGTQPADVTEDSKWGHTLHLLAGGGAGVEGAWQENLDWNSRGEPRLSSDTKFGHLHHSKRKKTDKQRPDSFVRPVLTEPVLGWSYFLISIEELRFSLVEIMNAEDKQPKEDRAHDQDNVNQALGGKRQPDQYGGDDET